MSRIFWKSGVGSVAFGGSTSGTRGAAASIPGVGGAGGGWARPRVGRRDRGPRLAGQGLEQVVGQGVGLQGRGGGRGRSGLRRRGRFRPHGLGSGQGVGLVEGAQRGGELGRGLVALVRVPGQGLEHDGDEGLVLGAGRQLA